MRGGDDEFTLDEATGERLCFADPFHFSNCLVHVDDCFSLSGDVKRAEWKNDSRSLNEGNLLSWAVDALD